MRRSIQVVALVVGVGVIAACLVAPMFSSVAVKSPTTKSLSNGKQLAVACRLYAADHGGRFPESLGELQPEYLTASELQALRCQIVEGDNATGQTVDWLYFGAGFDSTNAPRILIASPQVIGRGDKARRISIQGDTSGRVGPESEFQTLLAETTRQMQALHPSRPSEPKAVKPEPAPPPPQN